MCLNLLGHCRTRRICVFSLHDLAQRHGHEFHNVSVLKLSTFARNLIANEDGFSCGLSCTDSGSCFPEQSFTWDWTSMASGERFGEVAQMLMSLSENGRLVQ